MARYILYIALAVLSLACVNAQIQESPSFIEEDFVFEAEDNEPINIRSQNDEMKELIALEILEGLGSSPNSKRMWKVRPMAGRKPIPGAAKPTPGKPTVPVDARKPTPRPPLTPIKPVNKPITAPTPLKPNIAKPPFKPQPQLQLAPDMQAVTPQIFDTVSNVAATKPQTANKPKPQGQLPAQPQKPIAPHVPVNVQVKPQPVPPKVPQSTAQPQLVLAPEMSAIVPLVFDPQTNRPTVTTTVKPPANPLPSPALIPAPTQVTSVGAAPSMAPVTTLTAAPISAPTAASIPTPTATSAATSPSQTGVAPADVVAVKVQLEPFLEPEPFIPVVIERETTPLPAPALPIFDINSQMGPNAHNFAHELPVHELLLPDFSVTSEPFVEVVIERDTTPHPQYEHPVFIATTEQPPPPPMPEQLPPPVSPDQLATAHLPMPNQRPPPQYPQLKPTSPQPLVLVTPQQPQTFTPRPVLPHPTQVPHVPATVPQTSVPQTLRPQPHPPSAVSHTPPPQTFTPQVSTPQSPAPHLPSLHLPPHLPSPQQPPHLPVTQQLPHLPSPQLPAHSPLPQLPPQTPTTQQPPHLPSSQSPPQIPSLSHPPHLPSPPQELDIPISTAPSVQSPTPPIQPHAPAAQSIQSLPPETTISPTLTVTPATPTTPPPPPPPTVILPSGGTLIGTLMETVNGKPIEAFRGIPYAKPPVGRRRFEAPEPYPPITGIRHAQEDGSPCPQHEYLSINATFGNEDCLYLNVYTPQNRSVFEAFPVMVFFHGGGFNFGSSHSVAYGPERLLAHDVVLVTSNYRLGALGFLSTGTLDCPGNNGLKDQVEVLKWVQANIDAFGGNPKSVTIFGQSAGAASVTYHLVSPKTEGLFDKAIAQSGTNYDCWAFIRNRTAAYRAKRLRMILNCTTDGSWPHVLECLRKKSAEEIVSASSTFYSFGKDPITSFGPVAEPEHPEAYLTVDPRSISRPHSVHLPLIIGVNAEEGAMKSGPLTNLYDQTFRDKFHKVLPKLLYYDDWPKQTRIKITNKVDNFYFKGNHSWTKENPGELTSLFSDRHFYSGMDQYLRNRFAQRNGTFGDTFAYLFDQKGPITLSAQYGSGPFYYGVAHGDELPYLFTMNALNVPSLYNDGRFKWAMPRMWTDFAQTGTPTPDDSPVRKWKPATKFKLRYAHIGSKNVTDMVVIKNSVGFMDPKMRFWRGIEMNILTDNTDNEKATKLIP